MTPSYLGPLRVPDQQALPHLQQLCDLSAPYRLTPESQRLFDLAMMETDAWHRQRNEFWRALTTAEGTPAPPIPAAFFKRHATLSVPRSEVALHLTSSGTSGQKSQIFFDAWSINVAQRMVAFIFQHYGWYTPHAEVDYLLLSYEPQRNLKVGTSFTATYLCDFAPARNITYALRCVAARRGEESATATHEFDPFGALRAIERAAADGIPLRIFGFPSFLTAILRRREALGAPPLRLAPESLVFLGGGWKTHADKQIPKEELRSLINRTLGIAPERIRDSFGSVEHCVPIVECARHRLHLPVWSRATIRDVATLAPLPHGRRGFLHLSSPYITSVPAHSVLMGDIASSYPAEECDCGAETDWIILHGRAGISRNRSCAIAAAELLKGRS